MNMPRTLMSSTRSISSSVVSSNVFGMAVPALFTRMSRPSKVATVFSTAALPASASVASAWIAIAFPPARSISLTTDAAASAPFVYVMATFAPSAARRLAIAAPMPREPPVMSAIFPSSFFDIVLLLYAQSCRTLDRKKGQATFLFFAGCMELRSHHAAVHRQDAPGRPAGLIRREIDRGLRDLLRLPQPTQRMHPFDRGLELWILQEACDTRGHDSCRADAVASDVLFRVVHRHRLG